MHVLFTTQPALGHLLPLLPIADGLRGRGHEVAFATSASFATEVAASGYETWAAGLDWVADRMVDHFPDVAQIPPGPQRYAWARAAIFADRTARASVPDVVQAATTWPADLIVREAAEYGGCVAAEILELPHAVVRTDTGSSSYGDRCHVGPALDTTRARFGLPPDPNVDMPFRYLQLSFAPPGLDEPDDVAAPTYHDFRPVEPAMSDGTRTPRWAEARNSWPTVHVTLGTVYNNRELHADIVTALAAEPVNTVVTVGHSLDPASFGPQPAHVRIERWIPQRILLPQCDAVITHGGYGTVAAALTQGLPLVLVPISADQWINAQRCRDLGVGVVVDPPDRTPDGIRSALHAVLTDADHRHRAQRIAREAKRRPGIDDALALLETLARSRKRILRRRRV